MFKKILLGLVAIIAVFAVVVAFQPAAYQVQRSAAIAAPASVVFAQVNDFRNWGAWSPWAKLDPNMQQTFEGPDAGVGAVNTWTGNSEVGSGRMTILESRPNELVRIKLDFIEPFASTSTTTFEFKPQGGGDQTNVTWTMAGENNFIGKAFCLFMDMDKMIGGDFEKGLAQMKTVAEAKKG